MPIDNNGWSKNSGQKAALHLNITPQPKADRAREPVTRSRGLVRGQFPSTKMARMIAWESQLEQRACYHFEFSPAVKAYREQPKTFVIPSENGMFRYTPDFELTFQNGDISYVEVKPLSKVKKTKNMERLQSTDLFLKGKGYPFIILTEEELNFPIRIRNFSILRPYLRFQISAHISEQANEWVNQKNNTNLDELTRFLGMHSIAFSLIAQLSIGFDFDKTLENSSSIFPQNNRDLYETSFFTYRTAPDFEQYTLSTDPDA